MPTQTPMTVAEVFAGYDFRTNGGREGTTFYFNGHLTTKQITGAYSRTYPNPGAIGAYSLDATTARHAWQVFTPHAPDCYVTACAEAGDPIEPDAIFGARLCTCTALECQQYDGPGYEYRHPHPATPDTPGAIPITWVDAAW